MSYGTFLRLFGIELQEGEIYSLNVRGVARPLKKQLEAKR